MSLLILRSPLGSRVSTTSFAEHRMSKRLRIMHLLRKMISTNLLVFKCFSGNNRSLERQRSIRLPPHSYASNAYHCAHSEIKSKQS